MAFRPKFVRAAVAFACIAFASQLTALAKVATASTDGEATVYLNDDFSRPFDIVYRAALQPAVRNRSWTTLSMLLVGSKIPGPGASVGIASDPKSRRITPFTYVVFPDQTSAYEERRADCTRGCMLELRGDRARVSAYVDGALAGTWSRSDLNLRHAGLQLNAEAHGTGDGLVATLRPVRTIVDGHGVAPRCAFTTRGIEPSGRTTLHFAGRTNASPAAFVALPSGAHGERCG